MDFNKIINEIINRNDDKKILNTYILLDNINLNNDNIIGSNYIVTALMNNIMDSYYNECIDKRGMTANEASQFVNELEERLKSEPDYYFLAGEIDLQLLLK